MPLYEVHMSVRNIGTESAVVNVWADSEDDALTYARRTITYDELDWCSDDNADADEYSMDALSASYLTSNPDEGRADYGAYNEDDIPEEADDDYSSSRVSSQAIARYNMGEEIPA